jgi:hypothetical protein
MHLQYIKSAFLSKWAGPRRDSNPWSAPPCWASISRESCGSSRPPCARRGGPAIARRRSERMGGIS